MPTSSSQVAASAATNDDKVGIRATLWFQCVNVFSVLSIECVTYKLSSFVTSIPADTCAA